MSHYDKQWKHAGSIIRRRGNAFQVETNCNGQRKRHTEASLAAAKTYAEQKLIGVRNHGVASFSLNDGDRQDALDALDILRGNRPADPAKHLPTPLAEAAR